MGLGLWNSVAGSDARTCGIGPPGTGDGLRPPDHWTTGPSDRQTTGRRTRRPIDQNLWYGVELGFFQTVLSDSWDNDQLTCLLALKVGVRNLRVRSAVCCFSPGFLDNVFELSCMSHFGKVEFCEIHLHISTWPLVIRPVGWRRRCPLLVLWKMAIWVEDGTQGSIGLSGMEVETEAMASGGDCKRKYGTAVGTRRRPKRRRNSRRRIGPLKKGSVHGVQFGIAENPGWEERQLPQDL